jgi:hypothetical protein
MEGSGLFRNFKGQFFMDVAAQVGLYDPSYPYVVFGGKFVDYDNDGWLDIFAVSGHTQDDIARYEPNSTYPQPKLLFRNVNGRFEQVHDGPGGVLSRLKVGRGAAFGDLDNDGSVDVVVNNTNDFPEILRNDVGSRQKSLLVKLVGTTSNRDGIGTRLEFQYGDHVRILEAQTAGSYMSSNDPRVQIGLGSLSQVDKLILKWPSGKVQAIRNLAAGYLYLISEDTGVVSSTRLVPTPNRRAPAH